MSSPIAEWFKEAPSLDEPTAPPAPSGASRLRQSGGFTAPSDDEVDENPLCCECGKTMTTKHELQRGWCDDHEPPALRASGNQRVPYPGGFTAPSDDEVDEDPRCICGVYHSEHSMLGCSEGFQTPESWEIERAAIRDRIYDDDPDYYYHPNE